jgi:hypothetical protein
MIGYRYQIFAVERRPTDIYAYFFRMKPLKPICMMKKDAWSFKFLKKLCSKTIKQHPSIGTIIEPA